MTVISRLQPDSATSIGILTAVGVFGIYNNALPNVADIRSAAPHDDTVEKARKGAAWKSAGLVTLVFLVARDLNSFIISGAALVAMDYTYKHANAVHPATGKLDASGGGLTVAPGLAEAYPMDDFQNDAYGTSA